MINASRVRRDFVVIAASAGGIEALNKLLSKLDAQLPAAIAVVMHRSPSFESKLGEVLQRSTALRVVEPVTRVSPEAGTLYLAPRDRHMVVENGALCVHRGPKLHHTRPAADPLFTSAAHAFGPRVMGVVLSGGGADGTLGCIEIKKTGGVVLVQDEREAVMPYMPRSSLEHDSVDAVLRLADIAAAITKVASGESVEVERVPR
jgi:two-component system, chemotaxis family, protein-glutamate methylesterase/glutaminase